MTNPRDQRQDQLDRITARYEAEFRAGANPRLEDYVRRYPQFADELIEFALYFAAVTAQLPEDDFAPADQLSAGSQAALAAVRAELGLPAEVQPSTQTASPDSPAIDSLFARGVSLGLPPPQLAAATELSTDLLAKLEDRAIAVATIPRELFETLARALQTGADAVRAFLASPRGQARAGAQLYLAERPPEYPQESFAAAVRASTLSPERQRHWTDAAQREGLPD
ncbi:MAG TPA: hypothetical protein VFU88_16710 [Ktedonobacterales bacterium]|nr:hypothetical protein [Ktedonobacterales bacterium]